MIATSIQADRIIVAAANIDKLQIFVTPYFLLRVGGLPIDLADDLRFKETAVWMDAVCSLEKQLRARKDQLVDLLEGVFAEHKHDQALRRNLLDLKRDIFNMRMSNARVWNQVLENSLLISNLGPVAEWFELWKQHQETLMAGPAIFTSDLCRKRELLKEIVDTPDFRKGILLASPDLDQAISKYIGTDNLQLNKQARRVERSLLEYLYRITCKTSPFSTFTSVCFGAFERSQGSSHADVTYQLEDMTKRSFARLNVAVLSKLSSLILSLDEVRRDLPVQLTTGWQIEKNQIRYLRRRQTINDTEDAGPVILNFMHEDMFYLPVGRLLQELLDFLGDGRRVKLSEIVSHICKKPEYKQSEAEIEAYLQHLLQLGLLTVPHLQLDIHSKKPLTRYCENLAAITAPIITRITAWLEEINSMVDAYTTASVSARRELMLAIKQRVEQCYQELGEAHARAPRTLIYEDTTLNPRKLAISNANWDTLLADTAELQCLMPIFDVNMPRKLTMKGYFRARFGRGQRCDDFLTFANTFHRDFFEEFLKRSMTRNMLNNERRFFRRENHFKLPELELLDNARQSVADHISELAAKLPPGSQELLLDEDFLKALGSSIPSNIGDLQSVSCFSQFARVNGEPLLILNRVYNGLTMMFSRFAHFFTADEGYRLVPDLRAALEKLQPAGTVFAEMKGGYDATNLNLHPQLTAYELVCPGDISTRPKDEQISFEDLSIHDDSQADIYASTQSAWGKRSYRSISDS